jgi:hypothetical protein
LQRSSSFEGSSVGDSQDQSNGLESRTWGEDADSFSTNNPAENRVYDDKAAKLALEEAAAVSQEAEAFEFLRRELAVLESRVQQSARRANADMQVN